MQHAIIKGVRARLDYVDSFLKEFAEEVGEKEDVVWGDFEMFMVGWKKDWENQ